MSRQSRQRREVEKKCRCEGYVLATDKLASVAKDESNPKHIRLAMALAATYLSLNVPSNLLR